MIEWIQQTDGIWQYFVLFVLALAPLLDVFLVVPLGVALGLKPMAVGIIGFAGNFLMVLIFGLFLDSFQSGEKKEDKRRGLQHLQKEKQEQEEYGTDMDFQV